jgi:hypothetical protein
MGVFFARFVVTGPPASMTKVHQPQSAREMSWAAGTFAQQPRRSGDVATEFGMD